MNCPGALQAGALCLQHSAPLMLRALWFLCWRLVFNRNILPGFANVVVSSGGLCAGSMHLSSAFSQCVWATVMCFTLGTTGKVLRFVSGGLI